MSQNIVSFSGGVRRFDVYTDTGMDTGRYVEFNPADQSFAEDLYGLVSKLGKIHEKFVKEAETADAADRFDLSRAEDAEMRAAVDAMFGEGFCKDVFRTRLFALADGMTAVENFLYALLDKMDASVSENLAKRDARIKQYTQKYSKYTKKFHN